MGQILHGSARTTQKIPCAIQLRQESVEAAAKRYSISPTTIQKWRGRQSTADAAMGPKEPELTVLTPEDEAIIVAFQRHTSVETQRQRSSKAIARTTPSLLALFSIVTLHASHLPIRKRAQVTTTAWYAELRPTSWTPSRRCATHSGVNRLLPCPVASAADRNSASS